MAAKKYGFLGRIFLTEKHNGSESLKKYRNPFLVIHSIEDQTIPFELGKRMFDEANEPKAFYEIRQCHICGLNFYPDSIAGRIEKMGIRH
ncbi:MAG: hypothetical protein NTW10_10095 [Bacteroidetes bacterium]|nr:hypothetical protein [Bacteroidota bacterium]